MTIVTILFETITAAEKVYHTLHPLIDLDLDDNTITYDKIDEELVKWLIQDDYCEVGASNRVYLGSGPQSVLLIDDDFNLLMILAEYLEYKTDLRIFTVESGAAGWQFYLQNQPNLIVSGIAMEDIDSGYTLLQRVRERDLELPFIFLSTQLRIPSKRERAINIGASDCFCKPFEPEELFLAIANFLDLDC